MNNIQNLPKTLLHVESHLAFYLELINALPFNLESFGNFCYDASLLRRTLQPLAQLFLRLLVGHPHRLHLRADLANLTFLLHDPDRQLLILKMFMRLK